MEHSHVSELAFPSPCRSGIYVTVPRLRIALVIGAAKGGGAEKQWCLLAQELLAQKHQVYLITLLDTPCPELQEILRRGGEVVVLGGDRLHRAKGSIPRVCRVLGESVLRLRQWLHKHNPDVVYSALTTTNIVAWLATRGFLSNRLVWGIRGVWEPYPQFTKTLRYMQKHMAKRVPLIIANSHAARTAYQQWGFAPRAWEVVPNGFPQDTFVQDPARRTLARNTWGVPSDMLVLGCVARLTHEKDHSLLLHAFRIVCNQINATLILAGGQSSKRYYQKIRQLSQKLELSAHIHWLGPVDDVVEIYNGIDVLVLSSRFESFPNVLGEAMSCGCPCITTDVGDASKLVADAGIVTPRGDADALAHQILALARDTKRRKSLAMRGKTRIGKHFTPQQLAINTLSAIQKHILAPPHLH